MNKIRVKGIRINNSGIQMHGLAKYGRLIPPYFSIEIDIDTIKPRQKEKK